MGDPLIYYSRNQQDSFFNRGKGSGVRSYYREGNRVANFLANHIFSFVGTERQVYKYDSQLSTEVKVQAASQLSR